PNSLFVVQLLTLLRLFSFQSYAHHRHLHSFPTRRSSDLAFSLFSPSRWRLSPHGPQTRPPPRAPPANPRRNHRRVSAARCGSCCTAPRPKSGNGSPKNENVSRQPPRPSAQTPPPSSGTIN